MFIYNIFACVSYIISMSEVSKPVIIEEKTAKIMNIISETDQQFGQQINPTPGEVKRIELIRKMKQDTDKKEYMIMFNCLMIGLSVVSLVHFALYGTIISLVCVMFCLIYFVFIRKRLTSATLQLAEYKNNFDRYLWEGFYLKEMRYSAVKLAYFIFFPFFVVFLVDLIRWDEKNTIMWMSILIAAMLSTLAWWIYFRDDRDALESIESELKSLKYM
jgi:putative effector of murein hydrolase LrgA (UPF0299 family)